MRREITGLFSLGLLFASFAAKAGVLSVCAAPGLYKVASAIAEQSKQRLGLVITPVPAGKAIECRLAVNSGVSQMALTWNDDLDAMYMDKLIAASGRNQPFSNVDDSLKRIDRNNGKVVWIGVGWITWSELGALKGKGECNPTDTWPAKVCAEKWDGDEFKILQKVGHRGWPIGGFGISRRAVDTKEGDSVPDVVASAEVSRFSRDDFVVVADGAERKRRKVWFELWSPDGKEKLLESRNSTDDGARSGYPLPATRTASSGQRFDACGNPSGACAPYSIPESVERRLKAYFEQTGNQIWK